MKNKEQKKAMSRSWFLPKDDWVSDTEVTEKIATPFFGDSSKQDKETKEKK